MLAAVAAAVAIAASAGASAGETELRIAVWPQGRDAGRPASTSTLRCDPAGGSLRNPALACRKLAAQQKPFAPLPKDLQCTQLYGGPQEALVTGSYRGQRIWVLLSLRDGCRIDRWRRLAFLTPGYGTPGS